jgi:hypothetical protein
MQDGPAWFLAVVGHPPARPLLFFCATTGPLAAHARPVRPSGDRVPPGVWFRQTGPRCRPVGQPVASGRAVFTLGGKKKKTAGVSPRPTEAPLAFCNTYVFDSAAATWASAAPSARRRS